MRAIRARSGDAAFLRTLRESRFCGRVHSVFERVINIEDSSGELFTIASRALDDAPNTLVVDIPGFATHGVRPGDLAVATDNTLAVGKQLEIRLDAASEWNETLTTYAADVSALRENLATVSARIGRRGTGVCAWPPDAWPTVITVQMRAMLDRRAAALCAALCRGDVEAACRHGKAMLGLGPGATPSGDDFLVGLFAVLHIAHSPCERFKTVCADIVADVERSTNAISAAALKPAARGRVRESIHALMRELMTGRRESVVASLSPVLAIGCTSGTDIVSGIVSGLELNLQAAASMPFESSVPESIGA